MGLVYTHHEHWWNSSPACSHSTHISWLNHNRDDCFHIRSNPIRPSLNSHHRSLHNVPWDLHLVCLSSDRISLHSNLLPHHINHHIMHSKVWLFLHWPLAGCNPQDPLLDVCGDHVYHRSSPVSSPLYRKTINTPIHDACVDSACLPGHVVWNCCFRDIRISAPTSGYSYPHSWNYLPRPRNIDLCIHVQQLHRQADVEWPAIP